MYNRPRVIPVLGIIDDDLVKTNKYTNPRYLGDPINAVKIFNGKYVDELVIIDIRASVENKPINFELLSHIAQQAFMPLGYGGGIKTFEEVKKLFRIGYEKVIFNTAFIENPELLKKSVEYAGSQSVVVSLDFKKSIFGKYNLYIKSGTIKSNLSIDEIIDRIKSLNIGEVIVNVIDKDGTMSGYDLDIIRLISSLVDIPVIANTGAKDVGDFKLALKNGAHAVAASSIFVYYGKMKAVLITFLKQTEIETIGGNND
jgi:cyclase